MVKKEKYEKLKKEFGEYSSWAIWDDSKPEKPKSGVEGLSAFEEKNLSKTLKLLNTDYILFGLNAAKHEHFACEDWSSFHSSDIKKQQDYKIRYALKNTKLWGSYITDVFKGFPETDSKKLKEAVKKDHQMLVKAKQDLKKELQIIGGDPILIAFGNDSYKYLKTICSDLEVKNIIKIRHYSAWGGQEKYRSAIWEQLNKELESYI